MSQAGIAGRPTTQGSVYLPKLPVIQHPLANSLVPPPFVGVNSENRNSSRLSQRPLGSEVERSIPSRLSISQQVDRTASRKDGLLSPRNKAGSRGSSRCSGTHTDLDREVDEVIALIKEKCSTHLTEVQKRFKDNDPQGNGVVTHEALLRIIMTLITRPISLLMFQRLLERIRLNDHTMISFADFHVRFREVTRGVLPTWMTSISKPYSEKHSLTASQVHIMLKERARQRVLSTAALVPQRNPDGARRILKIEFRNSLHSLNIEMNDSEFEKLWQKYDEKNIGVIDATKLMKTLGVDMGDDAGESLSKAASRGPTRKELDRVRSLNTENWLKNRFREGFYALKAAFEKSDEQRLGFVSTDDFISALRNNGLNLEYKHLDEFLARCSIVLTKQGIPYREFLRQFQDRSEVGIPHRILGNPNHRYNRSIKSGSLANSSLSALEVQLLNIFQKDFLSLIGTFRKIDRFEQGHISQEEFRAAIESRLLVELSNDQFQSLIDQVPLTDDGDVRYVDFMAQFDSSGEMQSVFADEVSKTSNPAPQPTGVDSLILDTEDRPRRNVKVVTKVIQDLLNVRFKEFEEMFSKMEEYNAHRLSVETLHELLNKFDLDPPVSRGEIRELWKTVLTNKDGRLDWQQFVRHFGPSLNSPRIASKDSPLTGDSDFLKKSRNFNSDFVLLQDHLKLQIDLKWDDLRREFQRLDPEGSGAIPLQKFQEILAELCPRLCDPELSSITKKYISGQDRVAYIEFLRPFASKHEIWKKGNNMFDLLRQSVRELPISSVVESPHNGLVGLSARVRSKLSGDWRNLRRAFRKLDPSAAGLLALPEFRAVLQLSNIILDEEEVYHVMSICDEDMSGRVNYDKFISEVFRPETRVSRDASVCVVEK